MIDDFERMTSLSTPMQAWLLKLKDAVSDADHVLDEHQSQSLRRRSLSGRKVSELLQIPVSNYKMNHKVKCALIKFDVIERQALRFKLSYESLVREKTSRSGSEIDSEVRVADSEMVDLSAESSLIEKMLGILDSNICEELKASSGLIQKLRTKLLLVKDIMNDSQDPTKFDWDRLSHLMDAASFADHVVDQLQLEARRGRRPGTSIIREVHQLMLSTSTQSIVFRVKMNHTIKKVLRKFDHALIHSHTTRDRERSENESVTGRDITIMLCMHDLPVLSPLLDRVIEKMAAFEKDMLNRSALIITSNMFLDPCDFISTIIMRLNPISQFFTTVNMRLNRITFITAIITWLNRLSLITFINMNPLSFITFINMTLYRSSDSALIITNTQKLHSLLAALKDVTNDVDRRSRLSLQDRKRLLDIKEAVFDVDDVMDAFQIEAQHRRIAGEKQFKMFRKAAECFSPLGLMFNMTEKIEDLLTRLNESAELRSKLHFQEMPFSRSYEEPETHPFKIEPEVIIGREADKEKLIDSLISTGNDKDLSIVPIVGLAGVGKTTLAQLVFSDERIKEHFGLREWIHVGKDFDYRHFANSMLQRARDEICSLSNTEIIEIKERRFLLVVDNMENVNGRWEELKSWFAGGELGSKILVTTHSILDANVTCTMTPYWLQALSEEDCWVIFKNWASKSPEYETPKSAAIEGEIVKRCGGLPLAAKLLASVRLHKREQERLENKNCNFWTFCGGAFPSFFLLASSYYSLAPHLRQCFSYCSVFPLGYRIDRLKLIQIWMGEELIHSADPGMQTEDIGNQHFNGFLLSRFFECEEKDELGNVASCRINVLMHELVCHLARDEIRRNIALNQVLYHGRRSSSLIVDDNFTQSFEHNYYEMKKLRSLFLFSQKHCLAQDRLKIFLIDLSTFTSLRVLHLSNVGIRKIPSSMRKLRHLRFLDLSKNLFTDPQSIKILGKLKQLRFLDLSENMITLLPNSIATLYNLEVLNLSHCRQLRELPEGLVNISSLRHLDISECEGLTCMPRGFERLSLLRTLSLFIVGKELGCTIAQLQHLNQLRGQLRIEGLQNVQDPEEVKEAKLGEKLELQSLEVCWNGEVDDSTSSREAVDTDIFDNLQPHPDLRRLRIENYNSYRFPDWLTKLDPSSSFSKLEALSLHSLKRCKSLTNLSQMPSLKRLDINRMDAITEGTEFYGTGGTFPVLKSLSLCDLPNLHKWFVPELDMFPSLESLEISWCPKLSPTFLPSSIVKLTMMSSSEEFLAAEGGMQGLSKLKKLIVIGFDTTKFGLEGLQYLTALQDLTISCCPQLTHFPPVIMQQHFPSLTTLVLEFNSKLKYLGGEGEQPPVFFTELQHLTIVDCSALTALPEWLGSLKSFKSLKLKCCNKLSMLPDSLRQLNTLWQLSIDFCPILERRCMKGGLDWHKISHIPNIHINSD